MIVLGRELRASSVSKARSVTEGLRERREATIQAGTTFTAPVDIHSQPIRLTKFYLVQHVKGAPQTSEGRNGSPSLAEVFTSFSSHTRFIRKFMLLALLVTFTSQLSTCQDRVSTQ